MIWSSFEIQCVPFFLQDLLTIISSFTPKNNFDVEMQSQSNNGHVVGAKLGELVSLNNFTCNMKLLLYIVHWVLPSVVCITCTWIDCTLWIHHMLHLCIEYCHVLYLLLVLVLFVHCAFIICYVIYVLILLVLSKCLNGLSYVHCKSVIVHCVLIIVMLFMC